MPRRFVDRMGREITDPETIEARNMVMQLHRLENQSAKTGRKWPERVRVAELAAAAKMTPQRVIEIVHRYGSPWLIGLIKDGPADDWWVFQDGE